MHDKCVWCVPIAHVGLKPEAEGDYRVADTMGGEWSAKVEMEGKILEVNMELVLAESDGSLDIDEQQPQEYCRQAYSLF